MQRDLAYLLDILIAARKALAFVEGMTWQTFTESELHQNAVMRPLEIIGEAAAAASSVVAGPTGVKLVALSEVKGQPYASAAEVDVVLAESASQQ